MVNKKYLTGTSILIGTCIGAGVLGIPYVAAQSGFLIALAYILIVGAIILTINLYLGEVIIRTKKKHQLTGYAERYLGKKGKRLMSFAVLFGIYSALIAYMTGVGESLSFLITGGAGQHIIFGVFFGVLMSGLLWSGITSLKRFERWGVTAILVLLIVILFIFFKDFHMANLFYFNLDKMFLPFGVVLFAMLSFHAIPEVNFVLGKKRKLMKRILWTGSIVSVLFYILFTFAVVSFKGLDTPNVATLALGPIFIFLGIFTMFTSYLALGNALEEGFLFDRKFKHQKAWFFSAIFPIVLFLIVQSFDFFSFTKILSIGGVVSGGLVAVLTLFMVRKAKKNGDLKPKYSIPLNWLIITLLSLIFIAGVVREIWLAVV